MRTTYLLHSFDFASIFKYFCWLSWKAFSYHIGVWIWLQYFDRKIFSSKKFFIFWTNIFWFIYISAANFVEIKQQTKKTRLVNRRDCIQVKDFTGNIWAIALLSPSTFHLAGCFVSNLCSCELELFCYSYFFWWLYPLYYKCRTYQNCVISCAVLPLIFRKHRSFSLLARLTCVVVTFLSNAAFCKFFKFRGFEWDYKRKIGMLERLVSLR